MPDIDVQPAPGAMANNAPTPPPTDPAAAQAPAAPATDGAAPPSLPPDLLKLSPIQGLLSGAPSAVSMDISDFAKTEDGKIIAKNGQVLQAAGMDFFKSLHGDQGVIYNSMRIHPQDLLAADKAGKLASVAPPWHKVEHALSKAGANHPALTAKGAVGPAAPTPQQPPQAATGIVAEPGKPLPAKAQSQLLQARVAATMPPAPTGGPAPGSSQLLNRVLRPIV